jgi:hypothetical protein
VGIYRSHADESEQAVDVSGWRFGEENDMAQSPQRSVLEVLLTTVQEQHRKLTQGGSLQQTTVLDEVARLLAPYGNPELEEAILTQWHDLFRTGLLAWGLNLTNPNPPFFHLTERGRKALANVTRDPSNPVGYLRHLDGIPIPITTTAKSYVIEALDCYVAGLYKAAAVMIGAAAESSILEIRDAVVDKLKFTQKPVPSQLNSLSIKTVTDGLARVFDGINKKTHRELREKFQAHWGALTHEIRTTRNDAGHPTSVDPVTPESVHASLLLFPVLASLCGDLLKWSVDDLQ